MITKKDIQNLERISLSNFDVMNLVNNEANLVLYPDIKNYKNIDSLLGKYQACIILYLTKENYGHWCCIFKQTPHIIQFFDSYGEMVDSALDYNMDPYFKKHGGMDLPLLTRLLLDAYDKYEIRFNNFKFQEDKKDVNTCGRFCVVRLWLRNLNEYEFRNFMYSTPYSPDELVSLLTQEIR